MERELTLSSSNSPSSSHIIAERVAALRLTTPRLIVAIDGRGGAGKSSLARAVAPLVLGARHVEYDWFHLPYAQTTAERRFDDERLRREVLGPFRDGTRNFNFKRYNWGYLSGVEDGFAAEPINITDVDVIVLEGCGVLSAYLVDFYDLRVWVDTPAEEALARGIRRDIEEYGLDPSRTTAAWAEWSAWERSALARDNRKLRADVVV